MFQVGAVGNCLYESVLRQTVCPQEFVAEHLKRMVLAFMSVNHTWFRDRVKEDLRGTYTGPRDDPDSPGPFSYAEYLDYMHRRGSWGDEIILLAISLMWKVRISVIYAETLAVKRIRHDHDLATTDIILIYAGRQHYSAVGKVVYVLSGVVGMLRKVADVYELVVDVLTV